MHVSNLVPKQVNWILTGPIMLYHEPVMRLKRDPACVAFGEKQDCHLAEPYRAENHPCKIKKILAWWMQVGSQQILGDLHAQKFGIATANAKKVLLICDYGPSRPLPWATKKSN